MLNNICYYSKSRSAGKDVSGEGPSVRALKQSKLKEKRVNLP